MIKLENIKVKENLYLSDSVCVIVGDLKMYFAFVLCFYQKKNQKKKLVLKLVILIAMLSSEIERKKMGYYMHSWRLVQSSVLLSLMVFFNSPVSVYLSVVLYTQ